MHTRVYSAELPACDTHAKRDTRAFVKLPLVGTVHMPYE